MGNDHTLFSLVNGHVQFTREARRYIPPQRGRKWKNKPFRKYINVVRSPQDVKIVLTGLITPSQDSTGFQTSDM